MIDRSCTCHSCGKTVELGRQELPCRALRGWYMVSCFAGVESVDHYRFCSLGCLRSWIDSQMPEVPEVFLKSLGEEETDNK